MLEFPLNAIEPKRFYIYDVIMLLKTLLCASSSLVVENTNISFTFNHTYTFPSLYSLSKWLENLKNKWQMVLGAPGRSSL